MTHIFFGVHVDALFCFNCSNLKHVLFYSILKSPNEFLPRATWMVSLVEQDRLRFCTTWEHPILCWGSCCSGFSFVCSVYFYSFDLTSSFVFRSITSYTIVKTGEARTFHGVCLSNMRKYREPETLKLYLYLKRFLVYIYYGYVPYFSSTILNRSVFHKCCLSFLIFDSPLWTSSPVFNCLSTCR